MAKVKSVRRAHGFSSSAESKTPSWKSFVDRVKKMQPGDPMDPKTRFGSLVSEQQMQTVLGYIEKGPPKAPGSSPVGIACHHPRQWQRMFRTANCFRWRHQ